MIRTDVLVIGSGAAGLLLALRCASQGQSVTLATKGSVVESNTLWAQGGVAAALDLEDDSPAAHFHDTIEAGAGLCDERAAAVVAAEAPLRVEELQRLGVAFDLETGGSLELTREAAHSAARVAHAADATGRAISNTLTARALRHPNITVLERATAVELIVDGGACLGAWVVADGRLVPVLAAAATALATGGSGRIFERTTNPPGATADGLLLAHRAGALLADLEFVQFHPTALAVVGAPALLVSEAARGEGGILVDRAGRRFCFDADSRGELAPRDIVARAIYRQLHPNVGAHKANVGAHKANVGVDKANVGVDPRIDTPQTNTVYLDLSPIGTPDAIRARFPNIASACARFGIDIGSMRIPVAPAAHYHMGGVMTDPWGRTAVDALYAVGECACTGLHGANRLASNSLAECLVFASRAAEDIASNGGAHLAKDAPSPAAAFIEAPEGLAQIASIDWHGVGLERDAQGLRAAIDALDGLARERRAIDRASLEARSALFAARHVAASALIREESRGSHYRSDFPDRDDAHWQTRVVWSQRGREFAPIGMAV